MIAVVQRVHRAAVRLSGGEDIAHIQKGLMVLLCVEVGDGDAQARWMARKLTLLRIFADEAGRMNLDVSQSGGAVLVVSQFTLAGDTTTGNRPGYSRAARPEEAAPLVELVVSLLRQSGLAVGAGRFGESMEVELINDGPVTLLLRSAEAGLSGPQR